MIPYGLPILLAAIVMSALSGVTGIVEDMRRHLPGYKCSSSLSTDMFAGIFGAALGVVSYWFIATANWYYLFLMVVFLAILSPLVLASKLYAYHKDVLRLISGIKQ